MRLAWQTGLLRDGRDRSQEAAALSDRDHKPLTPQSISGLARGALDKQKQKDVRLIDLRHDFVLWKLLWAEGTSPAGAALWL